MSLYLHFECRWRPRPTALPKAAERREAVRDRTQASTAAIMDCESDESMFGDPPAQTTTDANTAYIKGPAQPGLRKRVAAAQEYKQIPEDFALSAIKELLLKEGLKNIPSLIKVTEKIFRHYSADGVEIARQEVMEMAAGARYYCEPGTPTGGKLRRRGAYSNYQQAWRRSRRRSSPQ